MHQVSSFGGSMGMSQCVEGFLIVWKCVFGHFLVHGSGSICSGTLQDLKPKR